jgi:hypothetical protein
MSFELLYPAPPPSVEVPRPAILEEMLVRAQEIGKDFPYVRVDLYEIDKKTVFGELTFYPGAGLERFSPPGWDLKFGSNWTKLTTESLSRSQDPRTV